MKKIRRFRIREKHVMNSLKVANALAKCIPLVTIAFLQDYLNCLNSKQALPNPKNYVPPMKELNLNAIDVSLSVNPARRHVFDGKKAQELCVLLITEQSDNK